MPSTIESDLDNNSMGSPDTEHPTVPTPQQIRDRRKMFGLTQTQAAGLIYRKRRNWQQWEGDERGMDPALWELFCLKTAALPPSVGPSAI